MIPVRNFLDQTVASPAKSVEMRARGEGSMFRDGLWGIDMVGFTGGGWVRLGASCFSSVCRIRFKYNDDGKSIDIISKDIILVGLETTI